MQSFIESIIDEIVDKQPDVQDIVFVLPSKRAGSFLRNALAKSVGKTLFSPKIHSIENFVESLSGIHYASNTQLLFILYDIYRKTGKGELDNFHAFSKWGQTLIQDFNEIDRHLINPKELFSNLSSIQEISIWSPDVQKTQMMEDYLRFWNTIENLYDNYNQSLIDQGLGHQGLVYRRAWDHIEDYISKNGKKHIFIGFNAMNTAESQIIQRLLSASLAEIYWDIDTSFLEDPVHDAGYFIRKYKKQWPHFQNNPFKGASNHYTASKNIKVIGVPKNVSQANYVGSILSKLHLEDPNILRNTSLVLGDETLLNPILHSVPPEIGAVNITMGYPLRHTLLAGMFDQFIGLYLHSGPHIWYYKAIEDFLSQPAIEILLRNKHENGAIKIREAIKLKNLTHLSPDVIHSLLEESSSIGALLFFADKLNPLQFVQKCLAIIAQLRPKLQVSERPLEMESLYRFHNLFNQIANLLRTNDFVTDQKSLQSLFRELLASETLDFQGDPLEGLQIMGMLESRNLDFETVIITSVNEGILPSGKSNSSFIPFDLKINFGLPTYKEKDAVYTYHFYRLLQRAKNIYLLYNTEPDMLEGGEKSRLIAQLETDETKIKDIVHSIAAPRIAPLENKLEVIEKNDSLMDLIKDHGSKGFSPSSLGNYIRNPIDFYKQNLLRIKESEEVEETIAANTFGTVVHQTLEDLYSPIKGEYLSESYLKGLLPKIEGIVKHHFSKSYMDSNIVRGKNLIAYKVMVRYIEKLIALEIDDIKNHRIKLIGLEENLRVQIEVPQLDFPIFLKGTIDRIDEKDGILRIIDYKTGKVEPKNVTISDWETVITDYDSSKAFQLLCYALMYHKEQPFPNAEAGIVTFKNLSAGLLKFSVKNSNARGDTDSMITQEILGIFNEKLNALLLEICDPTVPFTEKKL